MRILKVVAFLAVVGLSSQQINAAAVGREGEMMYVLEPFEDINPLWQLHNSAEQDSAGGGINITTSEECVVDGTRSLKIDYEVVKHRNWGGEVGLSAIMSDHVSCVGATHLSLWYKVIDPHSFASSSKSSVYLRLILLDSSNCTGTRNFCNQLQNLEHYYSFHHILADQSHVWKEIRVDLRGDASFLSPFVLPGWSGKVGNGALDVTSLAGFRLVFQMHWGTAFNATSSGSILFDQLACVGGGDLLSAAMHKKANENIVKPSSEQRSLQVVWDEFVDNQPFSTVLAQDQGDFVAVGGDTGMVSLDFPRYASQSTDQWGGELSIFHEAPDSSYYNLSQVAAICLDYQLPLNQFNATPSAILEVFLLDTTSKKHPIMTSMLSETTNSSSTLLVILHRQDLTDRGLDLARVKGFKLAVSLFSDSVVVNLQSIRIGAVKAIIPRPVGEEDVLDPELGTCVVEPGIYAEPRTYNGILESFTLVPFAAYQCCEVCEADPTCNYAVVRGADCYTASYIENPRKVHLIANNQRRQKNSLIWMDDSAKRGDFCEKCECRESDLTIDCRGADLLVLPKTFAFSGNLPEKRPMWQPRVLDLNNNSRLSIIGSSAFDSIPNTLKELRVPEQLRYISPVDLRRFSGNLNIIFEQKSGEGQLINAVALDETTFYGSVCCSPGENIPLNAPADGLTFCNATKDSVGSDTLYLPFWRYDEGSWLAAINPSSPLFSEASESVEKCAEYCAATRECKYFQYDQGIQMSYHSCILIWAKNTKKEPSEVEKEDRSPEDYADENMTIPGRISGFPPITRHDETNASVVVQRRSITLNEGNRFKAEIVFSLGSRPFRGAVWISPELDPLTLHGLDVTFVPEQVVLYDDTTTATVTMIVLNGASIRKRKEVVVLSKIDSCDIAFAVNNSACAVYVDVEPKKLNVVLVMCLVGAGLLAVLFGCGHLLIIYKRKQVDAMWLIKRSELSFAEPPEVAGRGTFGLVLLAEYRGTTVAVKRVIPPKDLCQRPVSLMASQSIESCTTNPSDRLSFASSSISALTHTQICRRSSNDKQLRRASLRGSFGDEESFGSRRVGGCDSKCSRHDSTHHSASGAAHHPQWRQLRDDFIVEMRTLSKLRHPCITTVMGAVIEKKEEHMLVMEFMNHGSLFDMLKNETLLLEGELLLPILRDVAQGVRFLHAATPQVIHGDLKAQNVLVDSKLRAKVADFGLSQKKRVGATGTPYWMAPELLRGKAKTSAKSDVYSFGIMLYEVYSRKDPYEGEDPEEVLRLVADPMVNKRPPCPASCPAQVKFLMNDCVAADPVNRPSFEELDQRLKRADASSLAPGEVLHSLQQLKKERLRLSRSNELLFEVFPPHIAKALSEGRKVEPEQKDLVTIFFSDIVGFTDIASSMSPMKVSHMLDCLYSKFDELSEQCDVFKVETIGDAYMAVTNLIKDQPDHCKILAEFAIAAVAAAHEVLIDADEPNRGTIKIRVGFDAGPVVANVVGSVNPRYCLFGDTVNTASRMESNSAVDRILCSERAALLLSKQAPSIHVRRRGKIQVKGKGEMVTYWVNDPVGQTAGPDGFDAKYKPAVFRRNSMPLLSDSTRK